MAGGGRKASPVAQGRVKMDLSLLGIGVSKDKLDIAVRASGEAFSASRDAAGLDAVIARLAPLSPIAVAAEAAGGFETAVAASLAGAGLPAAVMNPRSAPSRTRWASGPRLIRSMRWRSPILRRPQSQNSVRLLAKLPSISPILWQGGARSSG